MNYYSTLKAKLIYIFTIDDAAHRGCIKIGEATLDEATNITLPPNSRELNQAARKRIDQYTKTAGIAYHLHHTELTIGIRGGVLVSFNDKQVHNILMRSGIRRHDFSRHNQGSEWFECSVETAVKAIEAAKQGKSALNTTDIVPYTEPFILRDEQRAAVDKTLKRFRSGGKVMLWNAKMRFGKTPTALQVVKEMSFHRTIIITHRPVVDKSWFDDFPNIFKPEDGWRYGSRENGFKFEELESDAVFPDMHYVYFASIQDLRGAQLVGGNFDKHIGIFATDFDLVIIDEAHEGTQTELGQNVIKALTKPNTHILNLSGTPFNLLENYSENEIYTWDYVMEQKAKAEWDLNHFGDPNPYAGLPRMNIFTFDLGKVLEGYEDVEDKAFNFTEFFRVWDGDPQVDHKQMPDGYEGRFVHEQHVKNFLDLIVKYDKDSNYPFSTVEFRNSFRHTLWMIPGVKQARALSTMLKAHPIFGNFEIVNVAGEGDEEVPNDDALKMVEKAIGPNPEETYTITLSCGKLTTGVSVKPWTAVMYLAGSHKTDAKAYMQTIFRVQTPYTTQDGHRKENCYVFDFAPDRTLKVLAETAKVSNRAKSTATKDERIKLGEFLNFCPVIGFNGTKMDSYNVERMLEQLKAAYISRVTKNGCDDPRLYNQEMLQKLDKEALAKFKNLHKIIGATKANHTSTDVDMAKNGLTDEEYDKVEKAKCKKTREQTEEEKRLLEEAKEKRKNAESAISILRGISIRLPLLMYGAELKADGQDITLDNFAELIDDQSWAEFMPRGVTKQLFAEFVPYYDPDMFRAVGRNYRDLVRQADQMAPLERVKAVAAIFEYFRNPDKETVLTPWRVVNMHIGDCIGGRVFYEEDTTTKLMEPRFVDHGEVTRKVFRDPNTRILEINSKTGLYPLYMTYSVFAEKLQAYRDNHTLATDVPISIQNEIWDEVLRNNIFVICKTEMAKSITKRTLRGFRQAKVNAHYFEDLINKITNQPELFIKKMSNGKQYWKNNEIEENMKFNAIVGNPPYHLSNANDNQNRNTPIYHKFIQIAVAIKPQYMSMIAPARWYFNNILLGDFPQQFKKDTHLKELFDFPSAEDVFPSVEIKSGVCYFLWDVNHSGTCHIVEKFHKEIVESQRYLINEYDEGFIRYSKALPIIKKVHSFRETSFATIVSPQNPFGFNTAFKGVKESTVDSVIIISKGNNGLQENFVSRHQVSLHPEWIDQYKVLTPKAAEDGVLPGKVITKMHIVEPGKCCNGTFVLIGPFENERVFCENVISYMRTRFFRFLLGIKKPTQDIKDQTFSLIPLQDWSKPWTDAELYAKYNLTKDEIAYIESMIKPMGGDDTLLGED